MSDSQTLFAAAKALIPGGVNSPVRACHKVDSLPYFIESAKGCRLHTVEGVELIDYVMSWGPLLLGHCHPAVTEAVHQAVDKGASFGAPCEAEVELALAVTEALPSVEMVRMVNSGTEATMSALRLARACTGRDKILKFDGGYHGHGDAFLAAAGSGVIDHSSPETPGVPADTVKATLVAPYNDLDACKAFFEAHDDIAAVFVEPMAGNMGLVPAQPGFLEGLRALCDQYGALLVFDEVITGFRLGYSGAQGRFGITPDLTTLGKIIGGGLPVGAYGGKREYMERIAPSGDVYQAGTLSGNPLAMAAGLATLRELSRADYDGLERRTANLAVGLETILKEKGVPARVNTLASMFTIFFTESEVTDFASAATSDQKFLKPWYKQMRAAGINLAPSGFECAMVSFAHTDEDMEKTLEAARGVRF